MQQVLTDLDEPVSAQDEVGWWNVPVQQHARELAVENLGIVIPKAKVLTTGQSSANLCPAPIASSGFHGQEMVNLYPQTPVPETGDLIDFSAEEEQPGTSPAEALDTGQRVHDLCPTSAAVPEAQGEKVAVTSQQQIRIQGEKGEEMFAVPLQQSARVEEAVFPPQQRSEHLGDSTRDMSQQPDEGTEKKAAGSPPQRQLHSSGVEEVSLLPQQLAGAEGVESPAEVLATGQSATNLCPAPATTVEFQGAGAVGPSLQRQHDVVKLLLPAKSLATGQSATDLCLVPTVSLQLQEAGEIGPTAQQQTEPWNVKNHPGEALAAGERVIDLCPTPTNVSYSLQPRLEIMQTDCEFTLPD
ncbi:hypothetical protein AB205_0203090 [Aquarana catesbeiana]|uniref:Uncharacterized protein n=1 Tax=Aquarana catesbeiana TaxID=8400 RepID=A0A2G9SBH4_AQUCT|nr:hypothetical protein AB205_0203090 [Aquarana catesbeiana]